MEVLQNRIDSFKPKRQKGSSRSLKWPHPSHYKATPETLAEAGFYYNPASDDRDNVACYLCEKQLSGWDAEDDPFDIHWEKCARTCAWAIVRCGLRGDMNSHGRYTFPDKSRLPSSKAMERARLGTFSVGDGWPHDQNKNHGAVSRKMAAAGFVYTPQAPADDLVACLYCNISLSGWDADDDPLEEHRKRESKSGPCPFFLTTAKDTDPITIQKPTKPPSKSRSKSTSTTYQEVTLPTKSHDGAVRAEESASESSSMAASTRAGLRRSTSKKVESATESSGSKAPGRARSHTRSVSRSSARSKPALKDLSEEEEDSPLPTKTPKKTKGKSVKLIGREPEHDSDIQPVDLFSDSDVPKKASKPPVSADEAGGRKTVKPSRGGANKSKAGTPLSLGEEMEPPKPPLKKKGRLAKPKPSAIESEQEQTDDQPLRKSTRTRPPSSKASVSIRPNADHGSESEANDLSKPLPKSSTIQQSDAEMSEAEVISTKPKSKTRGKAKRPITKERTLSTIEDSPIKTVATSADVVEDAQAHSEEEPVVKGGASTRKKAVAPMVVSEAANDVSLMPTQDAPIRVKRMAPPQAAPDVKGDGLARGERTQTVQTPLPEKRLPTKPKQSPDSTSSRPSHSKEKGAAPPDQAETTMRVVEISTDEEGETDHPMVVDSPQPPPNHAEVNSNVPPQEQDDDMDDSHDTAQPQTPPRPTTTRRDVSPPLPIPALHAPLSAIPFAPITELSEAELDMTVEDWIRHHMKLEYDRFREDGERELDRFRQRAQEVRGLISAL